MATAFGKSHRNLLRKIDNLQCSEWFNQLNFERVTYKDTKGEQRPLVEMTKDGMTFLVLGFTGKKAAMVREAYVAELS